MKHPDVCLVPGLPRLYRISYVITALLLPCASALMVWRVCQSGLVFSDPLPRVDGTLRDLTLAFSPFLLSIIFWLAWLRLTFPKWRGATHRAVPLLPSDVVLWLESVIVRAMGLGYRLTQVDGLRCVIETRAPRGQVVEVSIDRKDDDLLGRVEHRYRSWILADTSEGAYADCVADFLVGSSGSVPRLRDVNGFAMLAFVTAIVSATLTLVESVCGYPWFTTSVLAKASCTLALLACLPWKHHVLGGYGRRLAVMALAISATSFTALNAGSRC